MKILLVMSVLLILASFSFAAELPPLAQVGEGGLVSAELIYELEGRATPQCHASTIVETPPGLVAAWFGGKHEKNPDVGIWVSRHDGTGWSTPVEVADGSRRRTRTTPAGTPCCSCRGGAVDAVLQSRSQPDTWWGMLMTSDDDGKTWSAPRKLGEDRSATHWAGQEQTDPAGRRLDPLPVQHRTRGLARALRTDHRLGKDLGSDWADQRRRGIRRHPAEHLDVCRRQAAGAVP